MRGFRLEKRYVFMAQLYVHDGKTHDLQPAEVLPVVHRVLPDLQGYIDVIIAHNYSQIADTNYKYNHSVAPI